MSRLAGGVVGTGRRTSSRRTTSTPGVCGPPANLCGENTTASLTSTPPAVVSRIRIGRYGAAAV